MIVSSNPVPASVYAEGQEPALASDALADLNVAGRSAFAGWPTRRDEDWKYTPARLFNLPGGRVPAKDAPLDPAKVPAGLAVENAVRLVFVNGRFMPSLSDDASALDCRIVPFSEEAPAPVVGAPSVVTGLNAGYLRDGLHIRVADGVDLQTPLHLLWLTAGDDARALSHGRILLELGTGAKAVVVESFVSDTPQTAGLATHVAGLAMGAGARLDHVTLTDVAAGVSLLSHVAGNLPETAEYRAFALSMGGAAVRRELDLTLSGTQASATVDAVYATDANRHHDINTVMRHAHADTFSSQTVKGLLDDKSSGVFRAKVAVDKGADGTDGRQLHKALLLSRDAQVNVRPELEIFADDVQCAHGAACGELDEDALFYMAARGIAPADARRLLLEGFVGELIDTVHNEAARAALTARMADWLGAHAGKGA